MAASMGLFEITSAYTPGSGGNNVAAGNLYFRSTNTASNTGTSSSDPVTKPASSFTNSYTKYLHPRAATGTGFTSVGNTYAYVQSTSLSTGCTAYFLTTNTNTYATPTVLSDNTTGTLAATGTTNSIASGSPKSLHTVATSAITSAGDVGDFLVAWASVASTASAGTMGSTVIVIQWDET